jgi:hypothetical protein
MATLLRWQPTDFNNWKCAPADDINAALEIKRDSARPAGSSKNKLPQPIISAKEV